MIPPGDVVVGTTPGDFHGRPTTRITNGVIQVEVVVAGGPRIVGLRRAGSPANLLAETPDLGWETALGRYELLGGHRLWIAPEDPGMVAVPDSSGLTIEPLIDGLRLTGAIEITTGCVRSMEIRLDPLLAALTVLHQVDNCGSRARELAPWSITQLPLGGLALLPQRPAVAGHRTRPNRNLVLWPYTSWDDARLQVTDGLVAVDAIPGAELKVGFLDDLGWVAYVRGGIAVVRRFEPAPGLMHPDLGCNVETYCGPRYVELEILGPLRMLRSGASTTLLERWEVRGVADGAGAQLRDELSRPIAGAATTPC